METRIYVYSAGRSRKHGFAWASHDDSGDPSQAGAQECYVLGESGQVEELPYSLLVSRAGDKGPYSVNLAGLVSGFYDFNQTREIRHAVRWENLGVDEALGLVLFLTEDFTRATESIRDAILQDSQVSKGFRVDWEKLHGLVKNRHVKNESTGSPLGAWPTVFQERPYSDWPRKLASELKEKGFPKGSSDRPWLLVLTPLTNSKFEREIRKKSLLYFHKGFQNSLSQTPPPSEPSKKKKRLLFALGAIVVLVVAALVVYASDLNKHPQHSPASTVSTPVPDVTRIDCVPIKEGEEWDAKIVRLGSTVVMRAFPESESDWEWSKDGKALSGVGGRVYEIRSVQAEHLGRYEVRQRELADPQLALKCGIILKSEIPSIPYPSPAFKK